MATGEPCEGAPAYLEASITTRDRLRATLTRDQVAYLGTLPDRGTVIDGAFTWHLVHAAPANPLHGYVPPDAPDARWAARWTDSSVNASLWGTPTWRSYGPSAEA
jgi:hypothetical protein